MADAQKKITDLPSALSINNNDLFTIVQGGNSAKTATTNQIGDKIATDQTFNTLSTTDKTLVGAINEAASSGGSAVEVTQVQTTGTKIATISVDSVDTDLYAPAGGGSEVEVTQIQTTGTKIATITVDSVDTDLYAPNGGGASSFADLTDVDIDDSTLTNGQVPVYNATSEKWENGTVGGSGGHTITDEEGTSFTQRENLQFNGAYIEDNSTDNATEVNVIRSMTKVEFDLLSDDEKQGIINVTDVTGNSENEFMPVIYSEDEREIGVWTDGKPLYEKTYHQTQLSISANTELTIDDFSTLFPVECYGVLHNSTDDRTYYPNWTYTSGNIYYRKNDSGNLVLRSESDSWGNTWELFTTVRYTKDSDTAGSGTWTPQGVPTHQYSTSEKIIGTWIDGSTIYERTFDKSSVSLTNGSWTNNVLGTNGSGIKIRKFSGIFNISDGGSYTNEPYADYIYFRSTTEYFTAVINNSGDDLNLRPNINGVTMTAGVCTIQYTKVSI